MVATALATPFIGSIGAVVMWAGLSSASLGGSVKAEQMAADSKYLDVTSRLLASNGGSE